MAEQEDLEEQTRVDTNSDVSIGTIEAQIDVLHDSIVLNKIVVANSSPQLPSPEPLKRHTRSLGPVADIPNVMKNMLERRKRKLGGYMMSNCLIAFIP